MIKQIFKPVKKLLRGWEIRQQSKCVSREDLIRDLESIKLPDGVILLVHSSLKSLGFVYNGPRSVLQALEEVVVKRRGGTLVIPTFSIRDTMHATMSAGETFDVRYTPSNLGAIPEAFRNYRGVQRSIHPTHSFCALGELSEWIIKDHHRATTNFGALTPMARAMEGGGLIAGLGTNLGTVTFYHCLEDLEVDFPIQVYSGDSPFKVKSLDWQGACHNKEYFAHDPNIRRTRIDLAENKVIRDFFTHRFEKYADLQYFNIGQTRGWYMSLEAMYAECNSLMKKGVTIYTAADSINTTTLNEEKSLGSSMPREAGEHQDTLK